MKASWRIKLAAAVVSVGLVAFAPISDAKPSKGTDATNENPFAGLVVTDSLLQDSTARSGTHQGHHHKGGGQGGSSGPPSGPPTCVDGTVDTSSTVSTLSPQGKKHHRRNGTIVANTVVTDVFNASKHHSRKSKGGGSTPPPVTSGPPCSPDGGSGGDGGTPDPCIVDPASCNLVSSDPPPPGPRQIPEPGTLTLVGLALGGAAWMRRRNRKPDR